MKNLVFFFSVLFVFSFVFSSCQEEIFEQEETSENNIVIKMSLPADASQGALKSAAEIQPIQNGDTIEVSELRKINIVFSAEDYNQNPVNGDWNIFLDDCDNDDHGQHRLVDRPEEVFENSNISSIKPIELGLYKVIFESRSGSVKFFLKHQGLPGSVGDDYENNYAFRLDKRQIYQVKESGWMNKEAYTIYLKALKHEFSHFSSQGGINPNDEKNWQALFFCENGSFTASNGYTYEAQNFKLNRCRYSPEYVCLTIFVKDFPPRNYWGGGKYYWIKFYSGVYPTNYWTFKAPEDSEWGQEGDIEFLTF